MAAKARFPSNASTAGLSSSRPSYASEYSTSATSTNSSTLLSSPQKCSVEIRGVRSGSTDPRPELHQDVRDYDADYENSAIGTSIATIISSSRDAEIILFKRMAKGKRLGLPIDVAALGLALCLYRGRTGIQNCYDWVHRQYGRLLTKGDAIATNALERMVIVMREVALELEIQQSQYIHINYSELQLLCNSSQDEAIAIMMTLQQRIAIKEPGSYRRDLPRPVYNRLKSPDSYAQPAMNEHPDEDKRRLQDEIAAMRRQRLEEERDITQHEADYPHSLMNESPDEDEKQLRYGFEAKRRQKIEESKAKARREVVRLERRNLGAEKRRLRVQKAKERLERVRLEDERRRIKKDAERYDSHDRDSFDADQKIPYAEQPYTEGPYAETTYRKREKIRLESDRVGQQELKVERERLERQKEIDKLESHEDLDDKVSFIESLQPPNAEIFNPDGAKQSGHASYVSRKRFVCVDISHDQHLLSNCEDCTKGKKYYSFYKAALHFRSYHLKDQAQELEGGQPSTDLLKQCITEVEELVPEHLAPYDDFNYIEDKSQVKPPGLESKHLSPVLATESKLEKLGISDSVSTIDNKHGEVPANMTDEARDEAVLPAISLGSRAAPILKSQESGLEESRSDKQDTPLDTIDLVSETVDADHMGPYPSRTDAFPFDVIIRNRRESSAFLISIFTFISSLMLSIYCGSSLPLFNILFADFEQYEALIWYAAWCIVGLIEDILITEPRPSTLVLEDMCYMFSVPRSQIIKYRWEWSIYQIKRFIYEMRMGILGNAALMTGDRQKKTYLPDQIRNSSLNSSTKAARFLGCAFLAQCPQICETLSHLAPGRPIKSNKKRIHNQCRCGYRIYDDYLELKDGAAARYNRLLQRRSPSISQGLSSERRVSSVGSGRESRISNLISSAMSLSGRLGAFGNNVFGQDGAGTSLPQYHLKTTNNERSRSSSRNDELLFLLLCVPHRQYATKLLQPQISAVRSDKDFFRLLQVNYQQMQGRVKRALSLKTLRSIKFVQLEMYKSELVDIRKQDDMPPEIKKDEYRYNPVPAEIIPPVGENHMLHLINHPSHAEEDGLLLDRIPKKLKERLLVCPSRGTGLGWGIYFIEGWHISIITLVAFAVVLAGSLAFLICWSVLKHDVQGASGVAAYMIAFLGLAIGSVQAVFELT